MPRIKMLKELLFIGYKDLKIIMKMLKQCLLKDIRIKGNQDKRMIVQRKTGEKDDCAKENRINE